jgi:hypothetical protein
MSAPGNDDLGAFLEGRSDLSRRYRAAAGNEEPPAGVSEAILAKARAAVEPAPVPARRRRSPLPWAVPFGLAATVLLTFALFRESPQDAGFPRVENGVVTEQAASTGAPADADAALRESSPVPLSVPAPTRQERADSVAKVNEGAAREPAAVSAAPPAAPPPPVTLEAEAVASVATTVAPAVVPPAAEPSGGNRAESPAAASPPASVARAASAPAALRAQADGGSPDLGAAKATRTPEAWLGEIRKLRAAGQSGPADEELKRFLEAYPGYFERNPAITRP